MAHTIVVHLTEEDPVVGEVDELPKQSDTLIRLLNPRRLDGNPLHYVAAGVVEVAWPLHRVSFIELMPAEDDLIVGFVRE